MIGKTVCFDQRQRFDLRLLSSFIALYSCPTKKSRINFVGPMLSKTYSFGTALLPFALFSRIRYKTVYIELESKCHCLSTQINDPF